MPRTNTANELVGKKYTRLTVLSFNHIDKNHNSIVKVKCDCGTEKLLKASVIRLGRVKSCGCLPSDNGKINAPKIKNKARKENHPAWKGGVTSESEIIRKSDAYKLWRSKVFHRDNFTCQKCFRKTRNLEAHHIFNFANNHTKRLDIDNGITFCKNCHKSFHLIYGYKTKTDIFQLYAFLGQ